MKKIIGILLIIAVLFSLTSCDTIRNSIKEESIEKIVGKILGEDVDVTILTPSPEEGEATPEPSDGILDGIIENAEEGEIEWPENVPENVPECGLAIKSRMKTPKGVILDFGETGEEPVKDYIEILKDNLYEIITEEISDKRIEGSYKKDESTVNIYWYKDGNFSLMITW